MTRHHSRTAALPLVVLAGLAGCAFPAFAQTAATPSAASQPPASPLPDPRFDALETRMKALEAKLDKLLAEETSKTQTPAASTPVADAGTAKDAAIAPASAPATATRLQPGWVVRTFPLAPQFLDKTGDVLSAFVLPESAFHLDDHVPHSMIARSTKVAYELTGFLDVREAGEQSLGLLIDEAGSAKCGARATIENQVVFEDNRMTGADKAFDPLIGTAKLDTGLYEVRIWIGCSNSAAKPLRARIIARTPSMSAPDVLPATRIGHKEL